MNKSPQKDAMHSLHATIKLQYYLTLATISVRCRDDVGSLPRRCRLVGATVSVRCCDDVGSLLRRCGLVGIRLYQ